MSHHEIPANDPAKYRVIVGWDHPLQTFFAQVIDRRAEDEGADKKIVMWIGCSLREIYEVEQLRRRLPKSIVRLSPEMGAKLYGDKDEGR